MNDLLKLYEELKRDGSFDELQDIDLDAVREQQALDKWEEILRISDLEDPFHGIN